MGLRRTARLWAVMHGAMADSAISCWRLKYDVGFWRPIQAIDPASPEDGNPNTAPEAAWTSLLPTPAYPDYVSGHACFTAPAAEAIRRMVGEDTRLTLQSGTLAPRTYGSLTEIERESFMARIWGGLHFRDAMQDGYRIGHTAARKVLDRVP